MGRLPANSAIRAERTAALLIERHGRGAFDFAARQAAILNLADAGGSVAEWRAIAMEIERLQAMEPAGEIH